MCTTPLVIRLSVLVYASRDGVEFVSDVVAKRHIFTADDCVLNIDDILPFISLNDPKVTLQRFLLLFLLELYDFRFTNFYSLLYQTLLHTFIIMIDFQSTILIKFLYIIEFYIENLLLRNIIQSVCGIYMINIYLCIQQYLGKHC